MGISSKLAYSWMAGADTGSETAAADSPKGGVPGPAVETELEGTLEDMVIYLESKKRLDGKGVLFVMGASRRSIFIKNILQVPIITSYKKGILYFQKRNPPSLVWNDAVTDVCVDPERLHKIIQKGSVDSTGKEQRNQNRAMCRCIEILKQLLRYTVCVFIPILKMSEPLNRMTGIVERKIVSKEMIADLLQHGKERKRCLLRLYVVLKDLFELGKLV